MRPTRILVTNDDGIHAPGLDVLAEIAAELCDDVWVVAPETDQSGVSHSISLSDPLRLRRVGEKRYAVKGTPSDCVIMGIRHVLEDKAPDLVLSGVNRGHNIAEDVTYSGTVAGAIEGTLLGVRSIALSQALEQELGPDLSFACSRALGAEAVFKVLEAGLAPGKLVNINFPACLPEQVEGTMVTRQGRRNLAFLSVEGRRDGRNNPYYWLTFGGRKSSDGPPPEEGTDLWAIANRRISITPLTIDLTDHAQREALSASFPPSG